VAREKAVICCEAEHDALPGLGSMGFRGSGAKIRSRSGGAVSSAVTFVVLPFVRGCRVTTPMPRTSRECYKVS
jgi:hypothetical protein